jgi:hypothetical protein
MPMIDRRLCVHTSTLPVPRQQVIGRSRSGWTGKIHAVVDALGNPVHRLLTSGEEADIRQARPLPDGLTSALPHFLWASGIAIGN